jgi:hypothetical protein
VRRTLPFVALWFVTGALAAAVATAGVAVVDDQLTSPRPAPLSAEQVRREVAASSATSTTASDGGVATTTTTRRRSDEVTSTTTAAGTGADGGPTATTTTPPAAPAAPPETRTYDLVGGTATLRFSAAGVTVLAASPAPGFTVDIGDSHDGGKRVEFESDDHRSRLDAWWAGGPQDEVREDD